MCGPVAESAITSLLLAKKVSEIDDRDLSLRVNPAQKPYRFLPIMQANHT